MEQISKKQFKITDDMLAKIEKRAANFIIDVLALSFLLFIGLVIFIANTTPEEGKVFVNRFLTNNLLQFSISAGFTLLYYNFFEIFTSRTIGKFCTNTIVVDENGEKANYEAIMIRSLIRVIPLYWISFILFPTRGLHDVVSKTYVVDKNLLAEKKRLFDALENK
ncbi:MAG TPA: RDD family protein [Flavobacterium sp.]|uniref:RDD family protein n=1 Tax=Flavobacterium sp. TaxID=239 RepID=UPI002BC9C24E|nr:RDD family protein [Flavobacterium sp.]HNP31707.1 RDD family protein [Flavobacterium sp.]